MRKKEEIKDYQLIDLLRAEKSTLLPPWGGWVSIIGNPLGPRGLRIPPAIHELGVHHLDIYYAYDEACPWRVTSDYLLDYKSAGEKIADIVAQLNSISDYQITWMTLHTPNSQLIRMWNGEVRPMSEELIKMALEENLLEVIPFGIQHDRPVWDEITRDMIGSLQLDGLSYQEAQFELITAGVEFERDPQLPPYFFRAIGEYKERFCEEEA